PMAEMLKQYNLWSGGRRVEMKAFYAMMRKAAGAEAIRRVRTDVKINGKEVINQATGRPRRSQPTGALAGYEFQGQVSPNTFVIDAQAVPEEAGELVAKSRVATLGSENSQRSKWRISAGELLRVVMQQGATSRYTCNRIQSKSS